MSMPKETADKILYDFLKVYIKALHQVWHDYYEIVEYEQYFLHIVWERFSAKFFDLRNAKLVVFFHY